MQQLPLAAHFPDLQIFLRLANLGILSQPYGWLDGRPLPAGTLLSLDDGPRHPPARYERVPVGEHRLQIYAPSYYYNYSPRYYNYSPSVTNYYGNPYGSYGYPSVPNYVSPYSYASPYSYRM